MPVQPERSLPDADAVATALGSALQLLADTLQGGWAREVGGVQRVFTGAPVATLNGVWAIRESCEVGEVRAGLDQVSREGVPFCLECRPGWRETGEVIATAGGLVGEADIPLMVAVGPLPMPRLEGLSLRQLGPGEARLHAEVAGPAFGAPPDVFAEVLTEEVLALGEVRGYVGDVEGQTVVTGLSVSLGEAVGIFNVATLEQHRGRGYGAAIAAEAVRDGFAHGAGYAWLQASQLGYSVYERLGFATLESWPCWTTPP